MYCPRFHVVMFLLLLAGCAAQKPAADQSPEAQADELERRWGDQYLKYDDQKEIARLNAAVDAARKTLGDDGRFKDLVYGPIITGRDGGQGWAEHLNRTVDLFTAWRLPGTAVHSNADFARWCVKPFEVYLAAPFDRNNPWGFGHPYANLIENNRIGRICLFARWDRKTFSQPDIERWAASIPRRCLHPIFVPSDDPATQFTRVSPGWEGGANVMWATRGELVPYLLSSDQNLRIRAIDAYMKHIWDSQVVRSPKGPLGQIERLTVDGMLGEHNAPAMGSYGEWYVNAVVEYRDLVQGVPRWQMPAELNAHWIDVLLDSVAYCYQGAIDPHLGNPLIWLNARKNGNAKLKEWLRAFATSGHRSAEVEQFLAWDPGVTPWPNTQQSVKYYYTTDYMSKHYPRFMVSLRAVSERTFGMETFAQKDKRWAIESILLPLGTCFVRRDTREYQDMDTKSVFSALDYARLPGQTTRHVSGEALAAAWNRDRDGFAVRMVSGGTPYAGGVAAPHTGVMAWWQSRYVNVDRDRPGEQKATDLSVNGRRATFFLEDAVVHLGAGFDIRHDTDATLTSLEQRRSGSPKTFYAVGEDQRTLERGQSVRDPKMAWAWHEGVGYLPPASGMTVVQDVVQKGSPDQQVFSMWTDHGREDRSLSFDWAVLPDVKLEDMPTLAAHRTWAVVANSPVLQAVAVPTKQWVGAAFHTPGILNELDTEIEVDRPAVLIVERIADGYTVYVSDPLQQGGVLSLRIGSHTVRVEWPGHPHLGRTVRVTVPR